METFADMGGGHLAEGEAPPAYNSSPATSAKHATSPVPRGIFITVVPDQFQVYHLEYGTVILLSSIRRVGLEAFDSLGLPYVGDYRDDVLVR